jgi:hypothetical protein
MVSQPLENIVTHYHAHNEPCPEPVHNEPCPEPVRFSPHPHILFLQD